MSIEIPAARARAMFSELLGRVAWAHAEFVITKKGKPVARLVPATGPAAAPPRPPAGGLADDDPFFEALEEIRRRPARVLPPRRRK